MSALRNIALNPRFPLAAVHVSTTYADATRLWDDPRAWSIGSAGVVDVLRHTPHASARENTAYSVRSLRVAFVDGRERPRPVPAAVILEMSHLAMDPKSGSEWNRLYVYVFSIIDALDEPPFPAERRMSPDSPDVTRRLRDFAAWFESHRQALEDLAVQQQPQLDRAQQLLAGSGKCASRSG
jgi:hypothetical protein